MILFPTSNIQAVTLPIAGRKLCTNGRQNAPMLNAGRQSIFNACSPLDFLRVISAPTAIIITFRRIPSAAIISMLNPISSIAEKLVIIDAGSVT